MGDRRGARVARHAFVRPRRLGRPPARPAHRTWALPLRGPSRRRPRPAPRPRRDLPGARAPRAARRLGRQHTLRELAPRDEGIAVLGVQPSQGSYLGVPNGETVLRAGDSLILYGRRAELAALDERRAGPEGDRAHAKGVRRQSEGAPTAPNDAPGGPAEEERERARPPARPKRLASPAVRASAGVASRRCRRGRARPPAAAMGSGDRAGRSPGRGSASGTTCGSRDGTAHSRRRPRPRGRTRASGVPA